MQFINYFVVLGTFQSTFCTKKESHHYDALKCRDD